MSSPLLTLCQVTKSYGKRRALSAVDLIIQPGDKLILCGPNGAGKSTLLRIIGEMLTPDPGGTLQWSDAKLNRTFFEPGFLQFSDLTVKEHFAFVSKFRGVTSFDDMFNHFGLNALADQSVGTLSRGWRARLGLALAFCGEPTLLLLDEPLDGLDTEGRELFFSAYQTFHEDSQCVSCVATHNPDLFQGDRVRIIQIQAGRILEDAA